MMNLCLLLWCHDDVARSGELVTPISFNKANVMGQALFVAIVQFRKIRRFQNIGVLLTDHDGNTRPIVFDTVL